MNPCLRRLCTEAPFMTEGALAALLNLPFPGRDVQVAEHPILKQVREKLRPQTTRLDGGIAVVPVEGTLPRKPDVFELFFGVEDTSAIQTLVDAAAADDEVKGILLNVDSPGGFLTGGPELADAVRNADKRKPVVMWSGGTVASLAYWIGSQAGTLVASRSASIGSIGVFMSVFDYTRLFEQFGVKVEVIKNKEAELKAAGIPGTSLSDAQRENFRASVQASFEEFRKAIRNVRPKVKDDAMRGQMFYAKEAKTAGLIDAVGDFTYAVSVLRSHIRFGRPGQ